jgi:hypothetical protein
MAEHQVDREKLYIEETRKLCEELVRKVNPNAPTKVEWKSGEGWKWNFAKDVITMDEQDLQTRSREYCLSVALHESLHVWMTRAEHFTNDEWGQLGFALGFNWAEDCGIENASDHAQNQGKQIIRAHLDEMTKKGGGLYIEINDMLDKRFQYVPKHMVLGATMRNYFYERQVSGSMNIGGKIDVVVGRDEIEESAIDPRKLQAFSDRVHQADEDVAKAFDQIRPLLEQFWDEIPPLFPSEEEIQAWAKKRADTYRKIWDIYKILVEESAEEHAIKKFTDALAKGEKFDGKDGTFIVIDFDSLPQEIQEEIRKKMDDASKDQDDQAGGGMGAAGGGSPSGAAKPGASSESPGVPWDKLSDEAKKAAKEAFDKVDKDQAQDVRDKAREELAGAEDDLNEKMGGHSDKSRKSEVEEAVKKEIEKRNGDSADGESDDQSGDGESGDSDEGDRGGAGDGKATGGKGQGEAKDTQDSPPPTTSSTETTAPPEPMSAEDERKLREYFDHPSSSEVDPTPKNDWTYTDYLERIPSIAWIIDNVYQPLFEAFRPKVNKKKIRNESEGELDEDRYDSYRDGNLENSNFMVVETRPQTPLYRFTLLVDLSGSIRDKIKEVFKMVVALSEVFAGLGIEFEVEGYTDFPGGTTIQPYRLYSETENFGDIISAESRERLTRLLTDGGGNTPTSQALMESYSYLAARNREVNDDKRRRNFLILLTDGMPSDSYGGRTPIDSAKNTVRYIYETKSKEDQVNVIPVGFGIGPGTESINSIFPRLPLSLRAEMADILNEEYATNTFTPDNVGISFKTAKDLGKVIAPIIKYMIDHPEEFSQSYADWKPEEQD